MMNPVRFKRGRVFFSSFFFKTIMQLHLNPLNTWFQVSFWTILTIAFTALECGPNLCASGEEGVWYLPLLLPDSFMGNSGAAASTHLPCAFHFVGNTSVHSSLQTSHGKEVSIPVACSHSATVSTCQSIVLFALSYIYVKGWQPHDNSLFSVDVGIQEVLKMILAALFILAKVILILCHSQL